MTSIEHLRLALDELEHRVEQAKDPADRRRFTLDLTLLEREVALQEDRVVAMDQALRLIRKRLHRLRTLA